jgi:hypothetical protein
MDDHLYGVCRLIDNMEIAVRRGELLGPASLSPDDEDSGYGDSPEM